MKFKNARTAVVAVAFVALAACFIANVAAGTWCGFGAGDIAVLCPVGALLSMVAAKTLVPRAVLSIVVAVALVLLLGRAFCGWVCPVTLWRRVGEFFKPVKKREAELAAASEENKALAAEEIEVLSAATREGHGCASCGACHAKRNAKFDSRHAVLGGAVLTTAVFGFPVFCLVCPVGLSFAAVALLVSLFGAGDLNWSLLFVPAMLVIELVFLRKWCGRFCPISAFMSLFSRFSRTAVPVIDNERCLETAKGVACSRCATVCTFDVNLRHPDLGELPVHDCARCGDCIDACPTNAIAFRAVAGKPVPFADAFASLRSGTTAKDRPAPALDDLEPEEA
ncbi:4Fe-4S binding protein [uncultured Adlercreutzia sp.]|uniref:4Fe-4S binding protein n=1 Tax=uncultured Adlercreutzia sp. TaxID=875803 RepID=UPI0026757BC4|nr:4Fe-4S binding protein [uncultured Adlercreutzia sp.]